jgi:pimeloyl-ACP methyl ester carboxylesterase
MSTIMTKDGTQIYYKDWRKGKPVVFSHGWPLTADDWDGQMLFFGQHGYRVIAHDRRGHGRSDQTWDGNEMDTYADDLAALFEKLDLQDAIMVGHSTGGGEVARYLARHGAKRVAKAAWKTKPAWAVISAKDRMLPPAMQESAAKKMEATTTTLPTCHMVILEEPAKVAAVIDEAAKQALTE